jgi:ABC-type polysaccharide/polyol phosphate export permease
MIPEKYKASPAMRFFLLVSGTILWTGIWLTGFDKVHWLLYVPPVTFYFAAGTGFCVGIGISRVLFRDG